MGILAVMLTLFVGAVIIGMLMIAWTGSSFVGLFLFPPLVVCLIVTGGKMSECSLGYVETDGTSWPYDTIFLPLIMFFDSQSHKFTTF